MAVGTRGAPLLEAIYGEPATVEVPIPFCGSKPGGICRRTVNAAIRGEDSVHPAVDVLDGEADWTNSGGESKLRRNTRFERVPDLQSKPEADNHSKRAPVHSAECASAQPEFHFLSIRSSSR